VDNQELFTYLYDEYVSKLTADGDTCAEDTASSVVAFCEFARDHFATNAPVHMGFEDTGIGFQLQDGTHLVFMEQRAAAPIDTGAAVPVTAPMTSNRGMASIRAMDDSIAITQGNEGNSKK
jgi:hypothetical protein